MKKAHKHTELSTKVCKTPGCDTKIKLRLVETQKDPIHCYRCNCDKEAGRGHNIGHHGAPRRKRVEAGLIVKTYPLKGRKSNEKTH